MPTGPSTFEGAEETAASLPRQLGSYLLLKRLGRGGMGTVYLARQSLGGSFERMCVVKLVRRRHLGDPLLRQRFLDEARTTLLLTHRNICRVLDVGMAEGVVYLAMEHVNGRDLRTVLKRCAARGHGVPPEIAAAILGEILEALDSAHRLVDPQTGSPLEIVHRDVSPHNVMVSFEGEVKLIDFGVARSATQLAQTDPGLVVGKLAYMSPEQASSVAVDGRSDVFAAGILGYEIFAADRFYSRLSIDEIGQMLDDGSYVPPRFSELPLGIAALLMRALTHDVSDRPRAGALRKDLMAWCVEHRKVAGAAEVRAFLADLFPGEAQEDRARFQSLLRKEGPPTDDDDPEPETASEGSIHANAAEPTLQDRPRRNPDSASTRSALKPAEPNKRGGGRMLLAAAAVMVLAGAAAGVVLTVPTLRPVAAFATVAPPPAAPPPVATPPVADSDATGAPPDEGDTPAPDRPEVARPDGARPDVARPDGAAGHRGHAHHAARPHAHRAHHATHAEAAGDAAVDNGGGAAGEDEGERQLPAGGAGDAPLDVGADATKPPPLPPRPRLLVEKVRYLKAHCAVLPCGTAAQRKLAGVGGMSADQAEAFRTDINRCLDTCGAP